MKKTLCKEVKEFCIQLFAIFHLPTSTSQIWHYFWRSGNHFLQYRLHIPRQGYGPDEAETAQSPSLSRQSHGHHHRVLYCRDEKTVVCNWEPIANYMSTVDISLYVYLRMQTFWGNLFKDMPSSYLSLLLSPWNTSKCPALLRSLLSTPGGGISSSSFCTTQLGSSSMNVSPMPTSVLHMVAKSHYQKHETATLFAKQASVKRASPLLLGRDWHFLVKKRRWW